MMPEVGLLEKAFRHVTGLMKSHLPTTMVFHNLRHTREVFDAVNEISKQSSLSSDELFIVQMAAVFHDCGYLFTYAGHEESSMAIAGTYLIQEGWDDKRIEQVTACIGATRIPQRPQNNIQQIICDADMYHFAKIDYPDYAERLKQEWEVHLNKKLDQLAWDQSNLEVLTHHEYFTAYGRNVWQPLKQKNIDLLKIAISTRTNSK